MLSPVFLGGVAGPRIRDAASDLVELWSLKGAADRDSPFEACADLRVATLEAMVGLLLGKELGMLRVESADRENAGDQKRLWLWDRGEREAHPRRFYRDFNLCLVCLDWVTQGISPTMYLLGAPFTHTKPVLRICSASVGGFTLAKSKPMRNPAAQIFLVIKRVIARLYGHERRGRRLGMSQRAEKKATVTSILIER